MSEEQQIVDIQEEVVLEKYEGEPDPENLVERITLINGEIVKHELLENGVVMKEVT